MAKRQSCLAYYFIFALVLIAAMLALAIMDLTREKEPGSLEGDKHIALRDINFPPILSVMPDKDGKGGYLNLEVHGRWGYDSVIFIDHGYDGTLDRIFVTIRGTTQEVTAKTLANGTQYLTKEKQISWEAWKTRFNDIRQEVAQGTLKIGN